MRRYRSASCAHRTAPHLVGVLFVRTDTQCTPHALCCTADKLEEVARPGLDFSGLPNVMLVQPGGALTFRNVGLSNIANADAFQPAPSQPYRNAGTGYGYFPSVVLAPNATVGALGAAA
jgi:hypothetical protein